MLFNGRDFSGWKQYGYGIWTVEKGKIVARYDHKREGPGYLFTVEEFGDFTLELEYWIAKGGNSGVYIRQPLREFEPRGDARPAHAPGDGVEVQNRLQRPSEHDRRDLQPAESHPRPGC